MFVNMLQFWLNQLAVIGGDKLHSRFDWTCHGFGLVESVAAVIGRCNWHVSLVYCLTGDADCLSTRNDTTTQCY